MQGVPEADSITLREPELIIDFGRVRDGEEDRCAARTGRRVRRTHLTSQVRVFCAKNPA